MSRQQVNESSTWFAPSDEKTFLAGRRDREARRTVKVTKDLVVRSCKVPVSLAGLIRGHGNANNKRVESSCCHFWP